MFKQFAVITVIPNISYIFRRLPSLCRLLCVVAPHYHYAYEPPSPAAGEITMSSLIYLLPDFWGRSGHLDARQLVEAEAAPRGKLKVEEL